MLRSIALGYSLSRCLHVVADLDVADQIAGDHRSTADLAAAVDAHPDTQNPASQLLKTDPPQSMRAFVRIFGQPVIGCSRSLSQLKTSESWCACESAESRR